MSDSWCVTLAQLDERQKEVIQLPLGGSHLIIGPPGSGKTNLLLLRASYLARAGQSNLLMLVFNRTLQEFVVKNQYDFASSKISTFRKWATAFLWQYGISSPITGDFDTQRVILVDNLRALIDSRKLSDMYDVILLDEAQEYMPAELEILFGLSRSIFAVADTQQRIYKGDGAAELLEKRLIKHQLIYNYRNNIEICRVADGLSRDRMVASLMAGAVHKEAIRPSSVTVLQTASLADQADRIANAVRAEVRAYPGELIGVLCPRMQDLEAIYHSPTFTDLQHLVTFQSPHGYMQFDHARPIYFVTLHGAKGLEFRTIHLAAVEELAKFPRSRNLAYMAITRAQTSVTVYHTHPLPRFLESALSMSASSNLEDLF